MASEYLLYPSGSSPVRKDKELVILSVFYHRSSDTLYIKYKNSVTGEKIMDEIHEPFIPVFISRSKRKAMEQFAPIETLTRIMVRYKRSLKEEDIKDLLYEAENIVYTDSNNVKQYRRIFKDVPKTAFALNPNLFFYGFSIEQLVMMEYSLQRFESSDGFRSEVIPPCPIDIGSFDIETIQEDGFIKININTFVDAKSNTAYGIYVKDFNKYPYQNTIQENIEQFKSEVVSELLDQINSTNLKASESDLSSMKEMFVNRVNTMKFEIIEVETEEELIRLSMEIMFERHSPDILVAFNAPYDVVNFQKRIEELNLPVGLFNEKKHIHTIPRFREGIDDDTWEMFGDSMNSKKRTCSFDVQRKTTILDYQMVHYAIRSFNTYSSESLQATAERNLGFGKLDFSKWSNSIVTLPYKNFRVHMKYALIDSILLIFLNDKLHDIDNRINYTIRTRNNMEQSVHSNPTISNWVATTMLDKGYVMGVNRNKLLKRITTADLETMSKLTGINFQEHRDNLPSSYITDDAAVVVDEEGGEVDLDAEYINKELKIRGGIVSPPQNYVVNFGDFKYHTILGNEVTLKVFLRSLRATYLDFMSHYPCSFLSRNLFMSTLCSDIVSLIGTDDEVILSKKLRIDSKKFVSNFGFLHMAMVNDDIITYASKACGTPNLTDIVSDVVKLDSEPNFTPDIQKVHQIPIMGNKYNKLLSLMGTLDNSKFKDTETNFFVQTNKMFLTGNGAIRYYGTRVDYDYGDNDLLNDMKNFKAISESEDMQTHLVIKKGSAKAAELISHDEYIPKDITPIPVEDYTEYQFIDDDIIHKLGGTTDQSIRVNLIEGLTPVFLTKTSVYFPFVYYAKQGDDFNKNKQPIVSRPRIQYKTKEHTSTIKINYTIDFCDIALSITQTMCVVNL